jgi:hypothetical protein
MHITTKVVSSNPVHSEVYSIQHYVIKFVSYIIAVSFIGEGNQSPKRKPQPFRKSLTNLIT